MKLVELVETTGSVAATSGRLEKIDRLATLLAGAPPDEAAIAVGWLCGRLSQGRIGVGGAAIRDAMPNEHADTPALELGEVDAAFERIDGVSGEGSTAERRRLLRTLMVRATVDEQNFLVRLIFGEIRQGALEGVMAEAVAKATGLPPADVRRAHMLEGNLAAVAAAALRDGAEGLASFRLELLRPVHPMLAQPVDDMAAALQRVSPAALEYKLDGVRVQVHKAGDEVHAFTRQLHDVTEAVPEVVEAVSSMAAESLILDGEAIALRDDGTPHPFQTTMRRIGRRLDVEALRRELSLSVTFFDCMHLDGVELIDRPAAERFETLARVTPGKHLVKRLVTGDLDEAQSFFERSLADGHEGVMVKSLDGPYEAGARGSSWLKVKSIHTLDLVVLAAEWGHGRRKGWLSNLHLGARDPVTGGFVMLGKTFKGMTDEILEWQTAELQAIEVSCDDHTVHVRPVLVVEVAFNDVQASPQYPGGVALRFARLKRYRPDKSPDEADTIDAVRALAPPDDQLRLFD